MAFKFLNIVGANKRIGELEEQVATITSERDEARKALETNTAEISAAGEEAQKALEKSTAACARLATDLERASATVGTQAAEIKTLTEKLASKDGEVKITVARQLAQEQAALGQPDKPTAPAAAPAAQPVSGISRVLAAAKADLEKSGYIPKR